MADDLDNGPEDINDPTAVTPEDADADATEALVHDGEGDTGEVADDEAGQDTDAA